MEECCSLGDDWYIFYHRQTNRSSYARQACAEKLQRRPDGSFCQAEVTSCGLNGGVRCGDRKIRGADRLQPLGKEGTGRYDCRLPKRKFAKHPYFTQSGKDREAGGDQYIANMQDGAVAGFKYFVLGEADKIAVEVRGSADGAMQVSADADFSRLLANIEIHGKRRPGGWFAEAWRRKQEIRRCFPLLRDRQH